MALTNDEILDAIANMTVQQAADLVKAMEEKFGVSAAAPVAVAAGPVAAAAEEQTEFTVTLDKVENKMGVIKAVKAALGISLIDAKGLVESAPSTLKEGLSKADADALIAAVKEAGGEASKK
ncbi:MAG TPA: 50S ribosomal protein L7/L12 [Treponema sp.]|jgi:large subunit ribosomal protein L7/L12|nr:50S ribosomal protein L7/L12 [Treponema sp.]